MPKVLRTFLDDLRRAYPSEVVSISKTVNPLTYDITAIVKHLGALKKFPVLIFEHPLNARGQPTDMKVVMSAENSQKKIQVALGLPADMDRAEMARECLRREAGKIGPVIVSKDAAPVKEIIQTGEQVDLYELPLLKHHEMDGGPYLDMSSVAKDRNSGVYNCSYHRMEVKDRNHTGFLMTLQHMWRIFRGYEEAGEECPVATVIGHHPAYQMGACYGGPFDISEYDIIGGYMQEPLRLTPSETWGERLLVPADAEIVIEGALLPGKRMVEGPFGEVNGYLGVQGYQQSAHYEVRAITRRRGALHTSILTPEGDKPWMDLAREGAYLRRAREAVPERAGGLHQRQARAAERFYFNEKDLRGRSRACRRRGTDLGLVQECFCLRRRHQRLRSDGNPLGDRDESAAAPAGFDHQGDHARQLDRPVHGRCAQDFGDDRRRHQTVGPAVLAGVEMSRRRHGANST